MNTTALAESAYARATSITPMPRDTEYRAFAEVTRRMTEAEPTPGGFPNLVDALHANRKLWHILAADVANDANGLPEALRAQIISLAEFVNQHTRRVLADGNDHTILVDINTAVMRGLRPDRGDL